MTLDEAIKHCEEVADTPCFTDKEAKCYSEHRQLAEWLKELRRLKEQEPCGDCINRQAVLDILKDKWNMFSDANDAMEESIDTIEAISSATAQPKIGQWIPTGYDGYADGNPVYDWWECSECGWEHTGDEESLTAFCPNCGAKMQEVEE